MSMPKRPRPEWLTFDCYGTLVEWDEALTRTFARILERDGSMKIDARRLREAYDRIEFSLEQQGGFTPFDTIAAEALRRTAAEHQLPFVSSDADDFLEAIRAIPPFPEVPPTLRQLKQQGFKLCIISNSTDRLIAGTVALLGEGVMDRVITAEAARAYKPNPRHFEHAWESIGAGKESTCHICASPLLDQTVARDLGFRCIWIDRGTGRKPLEDYTPDSTQPTLDKVLALFQSWAWI